MELHPLAITDPVAKEDHTIDWDGVKFPVRDTDWTSRGVNGGSRDQKDRSPHHEQGWDARLTTIIVLQVAGEEDVAICYKRYNTLALKMPKVLFSEINLQVSNLKFSILKQRIYI